MPELPEVESVRRTLVPFLGSPVTAIALHRPEFLLAYGCSPDALVGQTFTHTHRHGKKLFLSIGEGLTLHVHLGMSGRVDCCPADTPLFPHTHVVLTLASGTAVRFRDPRRFGGLWLYPTLAEALAKETANLGPDALTLAPEHLAHFRHTRGRLKARLLSQRDVAGLGNIYVDEALWMSSLHPLQRVARISPEQLKILVANIRQVLARSIRSGGTTLRDYRNVHNQPGAFARKLQVYGRGGLPCLRCQAELHVATIAGRTTVYCPRCQTRRR